MSINVVMHIRCGKVPRRGRPSHDGVGRVGGVLKNAAHVRRGTKWRYLSVLFVYILDKLQVIVKIPAIDINYI